MKKYVFNTKFILVLLFLLVGADLLFVSSSPSYKYYKQQAAKLEERLSKWENTFKKDYIDSIQNVALAISNRVANATTKNAQSTATKSSDITPILKPIDITRADYMYFEVNGVGGFSLAGRLVFRVGDLFLGRQIVSIDRFGAALSDGGLIRSGVSEKVEERKGGEK